MYINSSAGKDVQIRGKFVSGLILWFMDNLWFDDLRVG